MIEIKLRVWSKGEKYNQPTGKSGKLIRKKPYPPSFNRIPANKIDPDKGASTCAWGSHMWNGTTGILTRNPRENPKNNHFCKLASNFKYWRYVILSMPTWLYILIMLISINKLAESVKKNR